MSSIASFFEALFSSPEGTIAIVFFVLVIAPSMFWLAFNYKAKDVLGSFSMVTIWFLAAFVAVISPLSILFYLLYYSIYKRYFMPPAPPKQSCDDAKSASDTTTPAAPPLAKKECSNDSNKQEAPSKPEYRLCELIWTKSILFSRYVTGDPSVACTTYVWTSFFYVITKSIRDQELVDRIYSYYEDSTRPFVHANDAPDKVIQYVITRYRRFRPILNESGIDPRSPAGLHELWELTVQWAFPNVSLPENAETEFARHSKSLVNRALDFFDLRPKEEPIYLMEAANGMHVRVPHSKLEAWEAAQRGEGPRLSEETKQRLIDRIVADIYGHKSNKESSGDEP